MSEQKNVTSEFEKRYALQKAKLRRAGGIRDLITIVVILFVFVSEFAMSVVLIGFNLAITIADIATFAFFPIEVAIIVLAITHLWWYRRQRVEYNDWRKAEMRREQCAMTMTLQDRTGNSAQDLPVIVERAERLTALLRCFSEDD